MNNTQKLGLLGSAGLAAGVGAGLMYLLDPQAGGRRRALVRDKAVHALKKAGQAAGKVTCDLGNRTRGLLAETASKRHPEHPDAQVLHDRVRAKTSHVLGAGAALGAVGLGLLARGLKNRNGRGRAECIELPLEQHEQVEVEFLTLP